MINIIDFKNDDNWKQLIIDKIEELLIEYNKTLSDVISIYITGSGIFSDEARDLDLFIVVKDFDESINKKLVNMGDYYLDCFFYNETLVESFLNFSTDSSKAIFLFTLAFPNVIYGKTYNFDLLSNERNYKQMLKNLINQTIDIPNSNVAAMNILAKVAWWYIFPIVMFKDNSIEITDELKKVMTDLKEKTLNRKNWLIWINEQLNIIHSEGGE